MDVCWKESDILEIVLKYKENNHIDVIISFDEYGVSGHVNHRSIRYALDHALKNRLLNIPVYSLLSCSVFLKYFSFVGAFISYLIASSTSRNLVFFSIRNYTTAVAAMYQHKSQMLWFRYFYLLFSRYMFFNELKPINKKS